MLNLSKCGDLWIGKGKKNQSSCTHFGIKWPTEPIRCLGIYVGHDKRMKYEHNWSTKIDRFKNVLTSWKCRQLTLFGKIAIVKQLALPKLLYSATMLSVPNDIIKELNAIIYDFIWCGKDKVKRKVMINSVRKGGLNMFDIVSLFESIKAVLLRKYVLHCEQG